MSNSKDKLIKDYEMELFSPPCVPGSEHWSVKLTLDNDISEVLPYLNAELEGADYDHKAKVLVWKSDGKKFAFRPNEIKAAPILERDEAYPLSKEAVDVVNTVWSKKDEIEPDYERKRIPNVMEIYKYLPRTNCKECGYSTCMAFAAAVREYEAELCQCPELVKEENKDKLQQLEQLLGVA
jgi:ArsR family metal-binding transcriptional regulator